MKAQIDWIPLSIGAVRPTQGKTLAVMQVSGGSQSFNAVNQLRILGRWMRMITIPNQSAEIHAFDAGRVGLPHEPLLRAQGRRGKTRRAARTEGSLIAICAENAAQNKQFAVEDADAESTRSALCAMMRIEGVC